MNTFFVDGAFKEISPSSTSWHDLSVTLAALQRLLRFLSQFTV